VQRRLAGDLRRPPRIEEGERAAEREVVTAPQALPGDLRRPGESVEDARHVRELLQNGEDIRIGITTVDHDG